MSEVQKLYGNEEWSNKPFRTQVYLATHDEADKRLPHRLRSFISFTYGGKFIEDFSLIATIKGDRMERKLYGDFSDNTSTYDVIDGQFYWGTHFTTNKLSLQLSTDEMTERELQDFKNWFRPGEGRELILAEHPNRGIHARINSTPEYHMLPFEKKIYRKFAGNNYEISTTVYRGDIDLEFVMDDPFWYSIYNILPIYGQDGSEQWFTTLGLHANSSSLTDEIIQGINNSLVSNKDYLKIILEDGVPTRNMMDAGNEIILTGDNTFEVINSPTVQGEIDGVHYGDAIVGGWLGNIRTQGSRLASDKVINLYKDQLNFSKVYYYYPGSAPAPTLLSFSLTPRLDGNYISQPWNKQYNDAAARYNKEKSADEEAMATTSNYYNTIYFGNNEFRFTTPSLYTGYNQALDIITSVPEGTSTIDLHILLNDGVNEYYSRSWALGILNYLKAFQIGVNLETSQIDNKNKFDTAFSHMMQYFLKIKDEENSTEDEPKYKIPPASFQFDSKLGVATGKFLIRKFTDEGLDQWDKLARYKDEWNVRIHIRDKDIKDSSHIYLEEIQNELSNSYCANLFNLEPDQKITYKEFIYVNENNGENIGAKQIVDDLFNEKTPTDIIAAHLGELGGPQDLTVEQFQDDYNDFLNKYEEYVLQVNGQFKHILTAEIDELDERQLYKIDNNGKYELDEQENKIELPVIIRAWPNKPIAEVGDTLELKLNISNVSNYYLEYQWKTFISNDESIKLNQNWNDIQNWNNSNQTGNTTDTLIINSNSENNENIKKRIRHLYACRVKAYTDNTKTTDKGTYYSNIVRIGVVESKENLDESGPNWLDYSWLLFNAGFDMLDKEDNYLFTVKPFMDYTEEYSVTENVGDMIYGKYLYLEDKNWYDDEGYVRPESCTMITTDYPKGDHNGLNNFNLQYKYMYL